MPRLIDSASRADSLTLAINQLIATDGVAGLTLRRISEVSRVSGPTIVNRFGSKAHLLRIAASRTAEDRLDEFALRQPYDGLRALLPQPSERSWCRDATVQARVWLGWLELWRTDPALQHSLDDHHQRLRNYVAVLTEGQADPVTAEALLAITEGLQSRMAAPVRPLSPSVADELLATFLKAMGLQASPVQHGTPVPAHLRAAMNWLQHAGRGRDWRADPELVEAFRVDLRPTDRGRESSVG